LRSVQRIHLEPGDVLVYSVAKPLSAEAADAIREALKAAFGPDAAIVVMDQGSRLQVVADDRP
jgi:hypothetical protein